jgi:hypothetical protein
MECDRAALRAFGPDPQCDLLRHRAARHEDGSFLAELRRDRRLKRGERVPAPVDVAREIRRRRRRQLVEDGPWRTAEMVRERPRASRAQRGQLAVGQRRRPRSAISLR